MEPRKKYLIDEICRNIYNCNFKREYRPYFLKYFPEQSIEWETRYKLKPLGSIEKNNILGVVNRLCDYYKKVKYFEKLIDNIKVVEDCINNEIIFCDGINIDRDFLIYSYLKYWEKLNYIIVYNQKLDLKKMGKVNILVEKTLELNKKEVMCLLYWGNVSTLNYKSYESLENKVINMGWKNEEKKTVKIVFFENTDEFTATYKKINKKERIFWGNDFDLSISFAGMIFNATNFVYYNEMRLERFLKMGDSGKLLFLGTRNFLVNEIEPMDLSRFLYFSSVIFYFYGLRRPSDIDLTVYYDPIPKPYLERFFRYYRTDGNKLLGVGDLSIKGYGTWVKGGLKEHLDDWFLKEWPNMFKAEDYEDMIFNPRYHINIMGMKVICMEADLVRRMVRHRAAAYADLIAYNYFMPIKVKIDEPPKSYIVGHKEELYNTADKLRDLIRKIRNYLKSRYELVLTNDEIIGELNLGQNRINNIGIHIPVSIKNRVTHLRKMLNH